MAEGTVLCVAEGGAVRGSLGLRKVAAVSSTVGRLTPFLGEFRRGTPSCPVRSSALTLQNTEEGGPLGGGGL